METANSLQTIIVTAMKKFNVAQDAPLISFVFDTKTGVQFWVFRGKGNLMAVVEAPKDLDNSPESNPECLIFVHDDIFVPILYGKGDKSIDGADISPDGTHLIKVKPRRLRKVAKICEAWASDFIDRNGLEDYTLDVRKSYIPVSAE